MRARATPSHVATRTLALTASPAPQAPCRRRRGGLESAREAGTARIRLRERGLLRAHAVLDRHRGDEVDEARRVAPLVVVPRDELDEGRREHDARARVEDGRARLANEVRRHDLVLGVADDALAVRLRGELHLSLDLLVRG